MDPALFAELPDQAAPDRLGGALPRLRTVERRQVELRAVSLEALVAADHRVRLVWRFVEGLDLSPLYAGIKAVEGRPGHPPADPRILVALWAVRDGGGNRQRPRAGPSVRGASCLPVAVRRGRHEPQDAGRFPRRPRAGARGSAGRQLCRAVEDRGGEPGSRGPGRHAGAGLGRRGVVPPTLELAGVPSAGQGGCRAAAPRARRRSRSRRPATGGGAQAGGRGPRAPGRGRPGDRPSIARGATGTGTQAGRARRQEGRGGRRRDLRQGARAGERAAGFDHRCRGPGDEDGRRRLPAGLQCPVRRRHQERGGGRSVGGQPRLGHGQDGADERRPGHRVWHAAAPAIWPTAASPS